MTAFFKRFYGEPLPLSGKMTIMERGEGIADNCDIRRRK
jgi:hypothetical protein